MKVSEPVVIICRCLSGLTPLNKVHKIYYSICFTRVLCVDLNNIYIHRHIGLAVASSKFTLKPDAVPLPPSFYMALCLNKSSFFDLALC